MPTGDTIRLGGRIDKALRKAFGAEAVRVSIQESWNRLIVHAMRSGDHKTAWALLQMAEFDVDKKGATVMTEGTTEGTSEGTSEGTEEDHAQPEHPLALGARWDPRKLEYATTRSLVPGPIKTPPGPGWVMQKTFELDTRGHSSMVYAVWSRFKSDDHTEASPKLVDGDVHGPTVDRCIRVCERLSAEADPKDEAARVTIKVVRQCIEALKA